MSGSTHEPWGCMEQISWSELVVEYFDQACHGVFEDERMLIANATVKKMGLQGLFIEDFKDKLMGLRMWGGVLRGGRVGPKISSVNILISNQGCPMNNIIPLPERP